MTNKNKKIYYIFGLIAAGFCGIGAIFGFLEVNTTLGILPPPYEVVYSPVHVTGTYVSGMVYISILGTGIRENTTGISENGTYNFGFYRGTGPFSTGAAYSDSNKRTYMRTTQIINRIDNESPTFAGVTDGETYDTNVTITFSDNTPGATATINGNSFTNGGTLSSNGTYQLIVTDAAGNTTGATFIIYLTSTPSPSGGGGGMPSLSTWVLTKPFCESRSCYSYYYQDICGPCTITEEETEPQLPTDRPPYHYKNPASPSIVGSPYPQEWNDAYLWAYNLGITTMSNIKDADLEGMLYRKIAAKMASEFAIKVIGLTPDESRICEFNDISDEDPELQYYMRLSCKLGIMGLDYYGDPDTVFNPNYFVTRDQFVTILSRILFRNEYNIKRDELTIYDKAKNFIGHTISNIGHALGIDINLPTNLDRYTKHLEAIKKLGILSNYTLTMKEFRGYVMLIMYRIDQMGIQEIDQLQ